MRPWGSAQSPDPVRIGCYFPTARADLKGARQRHLPQFREINSPPHLDCTLSPQPTWDSLQWTGPTAMPWASLLINTRIFCFLEHNGTASPVWHHRNTTGPVHFIFSNTPISINWRTVICVRSLAERKWESFLTLLLSKSTLQIQCAWLQ